MGSDRFFPELAELRDDIQPDYIVVAHGTNDWRSNRTREWFQEKSKKFFYALQENYPNAKIFAISPI